MYIDLSMSAIALIVVGIILAFTLLNYLANTYPKVGLFNIFHRKHRLKLTLIIFCLILIILFLIPRVLISVPYGHAAVVWSRFSGGTQDKVYPEGSFLINPLNKAYIYNTKFQVANLDYDVTTSEGLKVKVNIAVRFKLMKNRLPELQEHVGQQYIQLLLYPEIGAWARYVFSQYTAEQIYTSKRKHIQLELHRFILKGMDHKAKASELVDFIAPEPNTDFYIYLQNILVRQIELPKMIEDAVNKKIAQFYLTQEYNFRIKVAQKEAQRKMEEARGIAEFQRIITGGISPNFLRWKGIEATLQLSNSKNAKIVVIGGKGDGLPIILGGIDKK